MNSKMMEIGSKDLISNLPDALICHILSFLSTTDAALTSVLAKKWRYLLAFVPNLDFDTRKPKMKWKDRGFNVFVDRVMALQGNARLNKFSLKCKFGRSLAFDDINRLISNVLDRGVLYLDLYNYSALSDYPLPSKVLVNKTLVSLKVGGKDEVTIDVEEVFLPKLKTLHLLDDIAFKDESGAAFAKLVSGCHVLEELVMINTMWGLMDYCSVSNPTLKRVTICAEIFDEIPKSVSLDTPNLVYLELTDTVAIKYPKVNFDSLVEASLNLRMTPDQLFDARDSVGDNSSNVGNATNFLMGMSNVKILYLSSNTLEVLTFCCKAIPVFNNLIQLTIETDQEVGWESLPNLLKNCPNLETLIFEGLHYRDTNQCEDKRFHFKDTTECRSKYTDMCLCKPWEDTPLCLSSSPVKMLKVLKFGEISSYRDDMDKQTAVIKYFLETMPNLEQVVLYYGTPYNSDLSIISSEFQMLEKAASPKCKIQLISDDISLSSTVGSSSSASGPLFFKNTFPV